MNPGPRPMAPTPRMWAVAWIHPVLPGRCRGCRAPVEWRGGGWTKPGTDTRHACRKAARAA